MSEEIQAEINLNDVARKLVKFIKYFLNYKWWFILVVFIGSCLSVVKRQNQEDVYVAETSLQINQENSGGIGDMLGLVSNIGFGKRGRGMEDAKFLDIAQSNDIIARTLLSSFKKDSTLLDLFLSISPRTEEFVSELFPDRWDYPDSISDFSEKDWTIIKNICFVLKGKMIVFETSEDGVISLTVKSNNQKFSVEFSTAYLNLVNSYFVEKNTLKDKIVVDKISFVVDSVRQVLFQKESELATFRDKNNFTVLSKGLTDLGRLEREVHILNMMYLQSVNRLEISKFKLLNNTPIIDVYDNPHYPLINEKQGVIKSVIIGAVVGGVVFVFFLFCFLLITKLKNSLQEVYI